MIPNEDEFQVSDQDRLAFLSKIGGKANQLMEVAETVKPTQSPKPKQQQQAVVTEVNKPTTKKQVIVETPTPSVIDEELYYGDDSDTPEFLTEEQYQQELVNDKLKVENQNKVKTEAQQNRELFENANRLYSADAEELEEILANSNLPEIIKEQYRKVRGGAIDESLYNALSEKDNKMTEIVERFGKNMPTANKPKPSVTTVSKPKMLNETAKPKTLEPQPYQQSQASGVSLSEIEKLLDRKLKEFTQNNLVISIGDTIKIAVGDSVFETDNLKFIGKRKVK